MKVIIAGTRTFNDYELLKIECDKICIDLPIVEIVSGRSKGADLLGEDYAFEKGYSIAYFPANWNEYGRAAGPIRNEEMAKYANIAIIFWDGKSKGAADMIKRAKAYSLKLRVYQYE